MLITTLLLAAAPWEGKIIVDVAPAGAEVFVDDNACAEPCEVSEPSPGRHVILVRKDGFEHRTVEIETKLDERKFVHVQLFALQTDPQKQLQFAKNVRTAGWVLLGTSLATMATAGILQLALVGKINDNTSGQWNLGDSVQGTPPNSPAWQWQRTQTASIGLAVAGGAVLAGAVAMLAFGPDPTGAAGKTKVDAVSVKPTIGPTVGGAHAGLTLGF